MNYTIANFKHDADIFNDISGQSSKVLTKDLMNQYALIVEEVSEIEDGFDNKCLVELLDGVVDTLYVTLGMLQKLKNLGVDTEGALQRVAEDNLKKFTPCKDVMADTVTWFSNEGFNVMVTYNTEHCVWVIKNPNTNKVYKPIDFNSTSLEDFVPRELKENFKNA